jgi:DNA-binding response OmpR family regulator
MVGTMAAIPAPTVPPQTLRGIRTAVVEDDHGLREDLVAYFAWRGAAVWGAASAEAFWAAHDAGAPVDLVLLDLGLPGESGLALAGRLRQQQVHVAVVMLTAFGTDIDRIAGLEQGGDAYLVKGASLQLLEATCRSVLRRIGIARSRTPQPPAAAWQLDVLQAVLRTPSGAEVRLTHLEQLFLSALMRSPGVAVARSDLLAAMVRPDTLEQLRNLDGCAARLRRKVQELQAGELPVRSYYGHGYAFGAPAQVLAG